MKILLEEKRVLDMKSKKDTIIYHPLKQDFTIFEEVKKEGVRRKMNTINQIIIHAYSATLK